MASKRISTDPAVLVTFKGVDYTRDKIDQLSLGELRNLKNEQSEQDRRNRMCGLAGLITGLIPLAGAFSAPDKLTAALCAMAGVFTMFLGGKSYLKGLRQDDRQTLDVIGGFKGNFENLTFDEPEYHKDLRHKIDTIKYDKLGL